MKETSKLTKFVHYLIRVPRSGKQTAQEAENFFNDLHRQLLSKESISQEHREISLELIVLNQYVHFFITTRIQTADIVLGQLYANFPGIEADNVQDYVECTPPKELAIAACDLRLEKKDLYPIKTYHNMEQDSLVGLSGVFGKIREDEQLWIQMVIKPIKESWHQELKRHLSRTIKWQIEPIGGKQAMDEKFLKLFFLTKVKLACLAPEQSTANSKLSALVNSFDRFDNGSINGFQGTHYLKGKTCRNWFMSRGLVGRKYHFNSEELASLYHFPGMSTPMANVVEVLSRKAEPPPNLAKAEFLKNHEISTFALTNFRNQYQPFGFKRIDRRRHIYLIGKTGMGKSKLLGLLMLSDIYAGKGFAVLDPHGDLAEEVLRFIPEERIKDVIYFNPADEEFPIGFNPLEASEPAYRQHIVAGFIGIFKKLFAFDWTPRLEHMLRYTTLALLDTQDATVVGIVRLLTNKTYRQEVIAQIEDPVVKNFWVHEFASWNEKFDNEAIVPLLNKIGEFISSPLIRNCLGQRRSSFTIQDVMENNKILILNLSSGKLGEENSALLGSMVVTQIQQAAMARARLPEEKRKDFYLYVDEFQNFATNAFATILSEARKYRLCLAMAHQYIGQLNEEVQKTVFGNVGSIITFRVGSNDAKFLETELSPVFNSEDLMNLDTRHVNLKMSIDGKTTPPFSAQTITLPQAPTDYSSQIVNFSRQTYARPRAQVEQEIRSWEKSEFKQSFNAEIEPEGTLIQNQEKSIAANSQVPAIEEQDEKRPKFEEPIV